MKSLGLLGCGNVGRIIAKQASGVSINAVFDVDQERAHQVGRICKARVCNSFDELLNQEFDILVEAASITAVRDHALAAIRAGRGLLILSVGALADTVFRVQLEQAAAANHRMIRIPSGAIAGLDGLKAGHISPLTSLRLRTTKSPQALDVDVTERTLIFRGPARECIERYPRNVNVAISLSIAANTEAEVELWADPAVTRNIHEVIAEGPFGHLETRVENVPCPDNPKTSYLAALSVLSLLQQLDSPLLVGT